MKALAIRQPWAYAVLHLGKRVENRDWAGCAYRGPVLLHASKTLVLREFDEAVDSIQSILETSGGMAPSSPTFAAFYDMVRLHPPGDKLGSWRPAPTLPLGGIVGRARIVGTVNAKTQTSGGLKAQLSPWYAGGFALVLADVEPLPFIPWKGSLGFFDVPDEVVQKATDNERRLSAVKDAAQAAGRELTAFEGHALLSGALSAADIARAERQRSC